MLTREQIEELEALARQEDEGRLLRELFDGAQNGRAALGVEPTLTALWFADVLTLVVANGIHVDGSECPSCGRLEPGSLVLCPMCDTPMRAVHDLFRF